MQKRLFFLVAMLLTLSLTAMAQITTSSMAGKVTLDDENGEEVIGATVIAVHEPSGTRYTAVTGFGLEELKDVLWNELNAESNKLAALTAEDSLVHRDKDMTRFAEELADEGEDEDIEYVDIDDVEDLEDFEYEDDEEDLT